MSLFALTPRRLSLAAALAVAAAGTLAAPATAAPTALAQATVRSQVNATISAAPATGTPFVPTPAGHTAVVVRTLKLAAGASIRFDGSGLATEVDAKGHTLATRRITPSVTTPLGTSTSIADDVLRGLFSPAAMTAPTSVVAVLAPGTTNSLVSAPGTRNRLARQASTSDPALNAGLRKVGARSLTPLATTAGAATPTPGSSAQTVVVDTGSSDLGSVVKTLRATHGVLSVEASRPVTSMATGDRPAPAARPVPARKALAVPGGAGTLPSNYALTDSLAAYLNGSGVDAMGAYSTLTGEYGQLPGTGEIITNVSIGDLTDSSMADAGDEYVQFYGPTTVVKSGQRYLDLPSMPLIPTYVAGADGSLDALGSVEGVDPTLDEVMLDFGVMAPLPHNLQRSAALGTGDTDLLGIAPGAKYRLVVPQQATTDQIAVAMLAAARQSPRPNVITASLGVGTDSVGFPGRYLEDDPLLEAVISTIVHQYGIVVTISANDGTRLFTPTAVNPDGGTTPTDVTTNPDKTTDVGDDALSTTPSRVLDSGAIAVGATTLDDVLTQPGQPVGNQVRTGTFAATRVNGATSYSSGFGSRVDVSAPGGGVAVFAHTVGGDAQAVTPGLNGGTSASAPMVAAAAAVVQQASRLAGHPLAPAAIRSLLESTGRTVASPAQSDRPATVGPQVDLSAAVRSVLAHAPAPRLAIVRVSLAHHVDLGNLEGDYSLATDPQRLLIQDEALMGPVTFGIDVAGRVAAGTSYELRVGKTIFSSSTPSIRVSPGQLLAAAGKKVISTDDRYIDYTVAVVKAGRTLTSVAGEVTVGPSDGTYIVARSPVVAPRVNLGAAVEVSYDLTGVTGTVSPRLVVSTVGHWSPTAGLFTPAYSVALTKTSGTLTLPASAFTGGGGLYGVGIAQRTSFGSFTYNVYADMASVLVLGPSRARPAVPVLTSATSPTYGGDTGHSLDVSRSAPAYDVGYDVRSVPGAVKTVYEISASGPTAFGALNTVTNAFGTGRDIDGVSTPSVAFTTVPATHGTLHLSAKSLPTDAVFYNIRVFGADRYGHVLGEASPTSGLTYDDGLAPNGGTVRSFDALSGADSLAAVDQPTGGQIVYHFDPKTGAYGSAVTSDATPGDGYQVVGVDSVLHRVVLLHFDTDTQHVAVETWSITTSTKIAATDYAVSDQFILGGRVDPAHHRALLLAHRGTDGDDVVLAVDLRSGKIGTPIVADTGSVPAGSFYDLELDPTSGAALLFKTTGGGSCASFSSFPIAKVSASTGAVTQFSGPSCLAGAAPDAHRGNIELLTYRTFSLNLAGNAILTEAPLGQPGSVTSGAAVRAEPPSLIVADGTSGAVLVGFNLPLSPARLGSPYGYPQDSNATGQLAEIDLTTGKTTKLLTGMEFGGNVSQGVYNGATERRVQLDPSIRTGWTFSADGSQLQAFTY